MKSTKHQPLTTAFNFNLLTGKSDISEENTHPLLREEAIFASLKAFFENRVSLKQIGKWILEGNAKAELYINIIIVHIHIFMNGNNELNEFARLILTKSIEKRTANENILLGVYYLVKKSTLDLNYVNPLQVPLCRQALDKENIEKAQDCFKRANQIKNNRHTYFWLAFFYKYATKGTHEINKKYLPSSEALARKAAFEPLPTRTSKATDYRPKGIYSASALNLLTAFDAKPTETRLRTLAVFYKIPDAIYMLGELLLNKDNSSAQDEGLSFLNQAMKLGHPMAANTLAAQCKGTGRFDLAALCHSAAAKNCFGSQVHLARLIKKKEFTTFSLLTRYRFCMSILHENVMEPSVCEPVKQTLKFLLGFKELVAELKRTVSINEDIAQCDAKTADELKQVLMAEHKASESPLKRALQHGDLALIKFYANIAQPRPSKNELLSEVLIHFNDHCKRAKPNDFDPNRYIHAIEQFLQDGATVPGEGKSESKDEVNNSIVVGLLQTLETLPANAPIEYSKALIHIISILIKKINLSFADLYAAIKSFCNKSHPFFYDDYRKFEKKNWELDKYASWQIIKSLILIKMNHLLENIPKLLDEQIKKKYFIKLYTLSLQLGYEDYNEFFAAHFKEIKKEDLKDAASIDIVDLLIAIVELAARKSDDPRLSSAINLVNPAALRELPLAYLKDKKKIINLLSVTNNPKALMIRYHTAMRILQILEPTHPCYQYAYGVMETLQQLTISKKIPDDIFRCRFEIAVVLKNFCTEGKEEVTVALTRAVANFDPEQLTQRLLEYNKNYEAKRKPLMDSLNAANEEIANLKAIKNRIDNSLKKYVTDVEKNFLMPLHPKENIRDNKIYTIPNEIEELEKKINTLQNSLKPIEEEKQKLMLDLCGRAIASLEKNYAESVESQSFEFLDKNLEVILILLQQNPNLLVQKIETQSIASKLLSIIKRVCETENIPNSPSDTLQNLISFIFNNPLNTEDRYDYMITILNNHIHRNNLNLRTFDSNIISDAIDSYNLCTRTPKEFKEHVGIVKSKLNIDRIAESLTLLTTHNCRVGPNTLVKIKHNLFRDIIHIKDIDIVANVLRNTIKLDTNFGDRQTRIYLIRMIIAKVPAVLQKMTLTEQSNIMLLLLDIFPTLMSDSNLYKKIILKMEEIQKKNVKVYSSSIITKICALIDPKNLIEPRFENITPADVNAYLDQCLAEESMYESVHSFCFLNRRPTVEYKEGKPESKEVKAESKKEIAPNFSEGQAEDKVIARFITGYASSL